MEKHSHFFVAFFLACSIFSMQATDGCMEAYRSKQLSPQEEKAIRRLTTMRLLPAFAKEAKDTDLWNHAKNLLLNFGKTQNDTKETPCSKIVSIVVEDSGVFMHIICSDKTEDWKLLSCNADKSLSKEEVTKAFEDLIGCDYKHKENTCLLSSINDIERPRKRTRSEEE